MKKKIKCFLMLLCCCCCLCTAQQVVSSGGYSVKPEISVNWILGGSLSDLPLMDLNAQNNLQRGRLMGNEIPLKVYPNPAVDFINIEMSSIDTGRVSIELYNSSGVKVLDRITASQPVIQINISNLSTGIYLLKIIPLSSKDQIFRVEKIIKY